MTIGTSSIMSSPTFWDDFSASFWKKKAGRFAEALSEPLVTGADVLALLRAIGRAFTTGARPDFDYAANLRFYVSGLSMNVDDPRIVAFLATDEDTTLESYLAHVRTRLQGAEFCMVIDGALRFSPDLWERSARFAREVVAFNGLPAKNIFCKVFLGNYHHTPFGVHTDPEDVFMFSVFPRKTLLVAPPETLAPDGGLRRSAPADIDRFRDAAASFCMESPRDVLYVPHRWWHVSDRDASEFHASVSLGFQAFTHDPHKSVSHYAADHAYELLRRELAGRLATQDVCDAFPVEAAGGSVSLPAPVEAALDACDRWVATGAFVDSLRARLTENWLRYLSAGVLTDRYDPIFPEPDRAVCTVDSRIVFVSPFISAERAGTVTTAVNGHLVDARWQAFVEPCRELMTDGGPVDVRTVVSVCQRSTAGHGPADDVLAFLRFLVSVRAIDVCA